MVDKDDYVNVGGVKDHAEWKELSFYGSWVPGVNSGGSSRSGSCILLFVEKFCPSPSAIVHCGAKKLHRFIFAISLSNQAIF